jgi:hypothetical protein
MTRSILAVLAAVAVVAALSGTGCQPSGVGDPCIPEAEYNPSFTGFSVDEVNTESESFQCLTRLCLVNHFQGRVTCPYGQGVDGSPPMPGGKSCGNINGGPNGGKPAGCCIPGTSAGVDGVDPSTGMFLDSMKQSAVAPQCTERTADKAVYCSCRCANVDGQTNDGRNYCKCPDGFSCVQLVPSVGVVSGGSNQGLTGGYCIKTGSDYDPSGVCEGCNPMLQNCGPV